MKFQISQRGQAMSKINDEITREYVNCCRELGLNSNIIHDNINQAPSYPAYYQRCLEYTAMAKAR